MLNAYNEINIEDFLNLYSNSKISYCANGGNAGDALIAFSTYCLFEKLQLQYQIISHDTQRFNEIIFFSGGGSLLEGFYKHSFDFLQRNLPVNKEIILLPNTISGYIELFSSKAPPNLKVICRERESYNRLVAAGFPLSQLFITQDLAFALPLNQLATNRAQETCSGTANCFRIDAERTDIEIPQDNFDISLTWNIHIWDNPDLAKYVSLSLASYLRPFESIRTNRLHIAILGALLGKQVLLYPNCYFKNKAVYEYTIQQHFPNVTFINESEPIAQITETIEPIIENAVVENTDPNISSKKSFTQIGYNKLLSTVAKYRSRLLKLDRD